MNTGLNRRKFTAAGLSIVAAAAIPVVTSSAAMPSAMVAILPDVSPVTAQTIIEAIHSKLLQAFALTPVPLYEHPYSIPRNEYADEAGRFYRVLKRVQKHASELGDTDLSFHASARKYWWLGEGVSGSVQKKIGPEFDELLTNLENYCTASIVAVKANHSAYRPDAAILG